MYNKVLIYLYLLYKNHKSYFLITEIKHENKFYSQKYFLVSFERDLIILLVL